METFKDRLLVEQKELLEKIVKLKSFVMSEKIYTIDPLQGAMLQVQLKAMETYSECLAIRLSNLN